MPQKIIIIRHGETDSNRKLIVQGHLDIPLNDTGINQAQAAALQLKEHHIDVIFSSDLLRAYVTAEHTAKHHDLPIQTTSLLRERYYGSLQGVSFSTVAKKANAEFIHFAQIVRGREKEYDAESDEEVLKRIKKFQNYLDEHKNKTVAIFTHGGLIAFLLRHFLYLTTDEVDKMSFPNACPIFLVKKGERYEIEK